MSEEIISVGIDLGTSTMQLIFSKIIIENLAGNYSVPRLSIIDKKIIYESEIIFTPMISKSKIDVKMAMKFIEDQYKAAGIKYEDVKTGAVIITGESARKNNAQDVLQSLSRFAGSFVVAAAGPRLESVLSGIGSSASEISKIENKNIINIDIGGGTSNISYFKSGVLKEASCLDIGGRLIKIDRKSKKITYIYHKIKDLAELNDIEISEGEIIDVVKFKKIAALMADILAEALTLKKSDSRDLNMYTNDEKPMDEKIELDGITFSGGVGDCIYNFKDDDYFKYDDIGIILAQAIRESPYFKEIKFYRPKETLRATVIGTGMHTTEISGSTISVSEDELPLMNVPILRINDEVRDVESYIKENIYTYSQECCQPIAISLSGNNINSFKEIQDLAEDIIKGCEILIDNNLPLVIVLENDIAKALGNSIIIKLKNYKRIICIDGIKTLNGDYLDIGHTMADGKIVPVIIKTLIFNT